MVAVSARSGTSSAVGPSSTLPYTVGATSTPLVRAVGTGSRMADSSGRASLSNTISSPRRGVIVNASPPSSRSIRSACSPAALISQRQRSGPRAVRTSCCSGPGSTSSTWVCSSSRTPAWTASVA